MFSAKGEAFDDPSTFILVSKRPHVTPRWIHTEPPLQDSNQLVVHLQHPPTSAVATLLNSFLTLGSKSRQSVSYGTHAFLQVSKCTGDKSSAQEDETHSQTLNAMPMHSWMCHRSVPLSHCCTRLPFSNLCSKSSCDMNGVFKSSLSPFLIQTLASCVSILPQSDLTFSETKDDSSQNSSHSNSQCQATNVVAYNEIHNDTRTGSSITMYSSNEEFQDELDCYYSESDFQSDDDVIFSDELVTEQQKDSVYHPCRITLPTQPLMKLLSQESGFGETSLTESCSDSEWDEGEPEREFINKETWNRFEAQAVFPLPTQLGKPPKRSTQLVSLSERLSISNVCTQRHRNCCFQKRTNNESPVSDRRKKVSFVCDSKLQCVHHIIVWNFAYRSCRKGPWEQYAIDRAHFRCRIDRVSSILEPCLQKKLESMKNGLKL